MQELNKTNNMERAGKVGISSHLRARIDRMLGDPVLLVDVSGSMSVRLKTGRRAIDELRDIVAQVPDGIRIVEFSDDVQEVTKNTVTSSPSGWTAMHKAFRWAKQHGFRRVVLVTDGMPTKPDEAEREAAGLHIGTVYVGDPPAPPFLERITTEHGGRFHVEDLTNSVKTLDTIKGLLGPAATHGPIDL